MPLIARVYPGGSGDVNHFHAAGGMGFVIAELLGAGLAHRDVLTVTAGDLGGFGTPGASTDATMLRPVADPFLADGGMRLVAGNLGRAIIKTSAVDPGRWTIEAPARIFEDQDAVIAAFQGRRA